MAALSGDICILAVHTSLVYAPVRCPVCLQIRRHQVVLKGIVSTVVVTTLVLEGWSSKLNPDIKIMSALRDMLPMSWHDRVTLIVDRFMTLDSALMAGA